MSNSNATGQRGRRGHQTVASRGRLGDYRSGAPTWLKALTEIITNSHQSFHSMMDEGHVFKEKQKIIVVADMSSETFTVIDYAGGIFGTWKDVEEILYKYSKFHKKTHTAQGRSSFGRGMSDVLYRDYENVCQICSKQKNGTSFAVKTFWDKTGTPEAEPTFEEIIDSNDPLMNLIPEHGTVIRFPWRSEHEKNNPFPNEIDLERKLTRYFELKNVLNDQEIDVELIFQIADGTNYQKTLKFFDYKKEELTSELSDVKLGIDFRKCKKCIDKYTGRSLYTMKKHCDECDQETIEVPLKIISAKTWKAVGIKLQLRGDEKTAGIFVEGEFKQIFDLTFFGLEDQYKSAAEKISGIIVFSSSVKTYMDYMQNDAHPENILTKTRDGFNQRTTFYNKFKKEIVPWLKNILQLESYNSNASDSNAWDEGIDILNDIAKDYLNIIEDGPGGPEKRKDVELFEFANPDPSIIHNKKTRITLRINTDRISPGEKIDFSLDGTEKRFYKFSTSTTTVPQPMKITKKDPDTGVITTIQTHEAQVKVIVECQKLDAEAQLYAKTLKKNKAQIFCVALLNCVDEPTVYPPTGDLQFSNGDRPIKAQAFEQKRAILFVHPNIHPGTKLEFKLKCLSHQGVDFPIRFENDQSADKNKEHKFYHVMEDTKLNKYDYRTVKLPFTCSQEDFEFRLEVSVFDDNSFDPTYTHIKIKNEEEKNKNILKGWDLIPKDKSDVFDDHTFESGDGFVKFFANNPTVSEYLGKNYEEAKQRVSKSQASAMFHAKGIMDAFFDHLVLEKARTPPGFDYGGDESAYGMSHIILQEKKELVFHKGKSVIGSFAQNIETSLSGGEAHEIKIGYNDHLFTFWNYPKETEVIPPPKVSKLDETIGKIANQTIFHFDMKHQNFDISVYEFDNDVYVISLSDFQTNGKYKLIFQELNNLIQVYKTPNLTPNWLDEKELVCSRIKLTQWVGKPNKRFIQKQIKEDEYALLPDSPVKNHQDTILETSNNWVNHNTGQRLVEIVNYEDIQNNPNTEFNGTLYHAVEKSDLHIMALLFLRTKFIPVIEKFDILKKDLNNYIVTCEKCGKTAEGFDEIISFIGVNFENKSPEINKLCKICDND